MNNNDYKDNNENLNSENTVDNKSSQNSGHRRSNVPVSYTHLDVYKRQMQVLEIYEKRHKNN